MPFFFILFFFIYLYRTKKNIYMEYQLAAIVQLRKKIDELENQVEELTIKLEKEQKETLTNHKYGDKHLS